MYVKHYLYIMTVNININILPLDEGVRVDKQTREKIITRDEVEGYNFFHRVC